MPAFIAAVFVIAAIAVAFGAFVSMRRALAGHSLDETLRVNGQTEAPARVYASPSVRERTLTRAA